MSRVGGAHRQHGQSTVEFLVLALVLLPLFLIVPLLGKQLDIAQTAASASRYVAFEGVVHHGSSLQPWKSDAQLADEVARARELEAIGFTQLVLAASEQIGWTGGFAVVA